MKSIAKKVKHLREFHNYTQEFMAEKLNVSQQTYSRLEKGEKPLTLDIVQSVADLFEIDPLELLASEEKFVIYDTGDHSTIGYYGTHNINSGISTKEKELYEKEIALLKQEIAILKEKLILAEQKINNSK